MGNISVLIFVSFTFLPIQLAEYCAHYPGDIKFVYHQLKDEVRYIQKYGANVLTKYRAQYSNSNSHLYQQGPTPGNVNTEEKHGGGETHETQQGHTNEHEKQGHANESGVHHAKIDSRERVLNDEHENSGKSASSTGGGGGDGHTAEEVNVEKILPVWKLEMPRNVLTAVLVKIDPNGKVEDKFDFYKDDFDNKNLTTFHGRYSKHIDITPLSIILDGTYVVCANLHNVISKKEYICQHCTLITASENEAEQKSLVGEIVEEESKADSVLIKYSVKNMPFPIAMVKTSVTLERGKSGRCLNGDKEKPAAFESLDPLLKDTVVFVEIKNLLDSYDYSIEVGLELKWSENNLPEGLPSPVVETRFYLTEEKRVVKNEEENLHIPKCHSKTSHERAN